MSVSLMFFAAGLDAEIAAAAAKEGNLYIYGTIDKKVGAALVKDFNSLYLVVKVDYCQSSNPSQFGNVLD